MAIDTLDPRYVKTQDLWHLVKDYYEFTGSKAGEMVMKIALNSRSTAAFLTYGDEESCHRTVQTSQSYISGIKTGVETFVSDEDEKEALCAVLTAISDVLEGASATYESSRSYPAAIASILHVTPKDPAVWWEECSPGTLWVRNDWIDEVPIMVERQKNGSWKWSLSRDRAAGVEATKLDAMRAGEREFGWTEKPLNEEED